MTCVVIAGCLPAYISQDVPLVKLTQQCRTWLYAMRFSTALSSHETAPLRSQAYLIQGAAAIASVQWQLPL